MKMRENFSLKQKRERNETKVYVLTQLNITYLIYFIQFKLFNNFNIYKII